MSTAAIVAGTVGAGAIGAIGANMAAGKQASAANNAANLQAQESQNALNFQQQVYNNSLAMGAPWLQTGTAAIGQLRQLMGLGSNPQPQQGPWGGPAGQGTNTFQGAGPQFGGGPIAMNALNGDLSVNPLGGTQSFAGGGINPTIPMSSTGPSSQLTVPNPAAPQGGGMNTPFTSWDQQFQAPTNVTEQNDPGYQFRLQQGQQALENSAAARGGLLSGGTMKAEQQFGQDYASNEYQNVYNRALGEYQQNYNIFQNNQNTEFNRLAALSGVGQTQAAQLGSFGQQAASNAGNIFMNTGQQIGNSLQNAGAATASGYAGVANSLGGIGSNLGQLAFLNQLLG